MKPGELFKPYGTEAVLLYEGGGVFSVEAGDPSPLLPSPLDGKIHFDTVPPMHRAWHWSDLATPTQAKKYPTEKSLQAEVVYEEILFSGKKILVLNKTLYFYTPEL